jgi:hypothetical protein
MVEEEEEGAEQKRGCTGACSKARGRRLDTPQFPISWVRGDGDVDLQASKRQGARYVCSYIIRVHVLRIWATPHGSSARFGCMHARQTAARTRTGLGRHRRQRRLYSSQCG